MVRTRFAPSPTGYLHIGNVRTAIMNWIFARQAGGEFILRIEDTDAERSTKESEKSIIDDLNWLGLFWDEGPDKGGDYGPYYQSERLELYRTYAEKLKNKGRAYECYCTAEELEIRRKKRTAAGESVLYDRRCLKLSFEQKEEFKKLGRKPSLRFYVDDDVARFEDLVKGEIDFSDEKFGDFIILRADGMPMYNFACVVDDHLMKITHVVRGDDHVSNTPRQILIYNAFNWDPPAFAHIPMILGGDRTRLSKRHGATSVLQFREQGYLPDALFNFLSRLSWSSESGDELLSRERLIKEFDFRRVSESSAVFDTVKLDWMNGVYIRELTEEKFAQVVFPFLKKNGFPVDSPESLISVISVLQEKIEKLSQISNKAAILFQNEVVPEDEEAEGILKIPESKEVLTILLDELRNVDKLKDNNFYTLLKKITERTGIKGKKLWMPVRVALTGQMHGPDLTNVVEILGVEKCSKFIESAIKDY